MTLRAIGGLVVFNLFVLGVGGGVLWGIRGWRWWTDAVRLAGLAYFLGLASLMVVLTIELTLGIPVGVLTIALTGAAVAGAGVGVGRARKHVAPAVHPPGWSFPRLSLFAALFLAGIVVYLEGLFRADRLSGITKEWDSWAFWMPKAKEIYFFDRLGPDFLLDLPQRPSYPPGLATVQAGAFHAMGSADTVSLHVQYWFFAAAFVAAVVGVLARRVRAAILYPVLLAFLVAPSLVERITTLYADIPLGYLLALGALLLLLWIDERNTWQLAAATLLLGGAMLTKREGILFAACVFLAAFVASWTQRHELWRRLALAGVAAFALTLPWRIWFTAHGLESDGPDSGYLGAFTYLDRVEPALRLAVSTLFLPELWRSVPLLAVAAIVVAALGGAWRTSVFAGVFIVAAVAGATWVTWAYTLLPITRDEAQNPIIRITGNTILVLAVLTPLLLQHAWTGGRKAPEAPARAGTALGADAIVWRSHWAWLIVLVGVLSHPGAMLVGYSGSGLPGGAPRWPRPTDCVVAPAPGHDTRVVVGYADSYPEADGMRERAAAAGLTGTRVTHDGCGRLRVFVDIRSPESTERLLVAARAAELEPTLEGIGNPR